MTVKSMWSGCQAYVLCGLSYSPCILRLKYLDNNNHSTYPQSTGQTNKRLEYSWAFYMTARGQYPNPSTPQWAGFWSGSIDPCNSYQCFFSCYKWDFYNALVKDKSVGKLQNNLKNAIDIYPQPQAIGPSGFSKPHPL